MPSLKNENGHCEAQCQARKSIDVIIIVCNDNPSKCTITKRSDFFVLLSKAPPKRSLASKVEARNGSGKVGCRRIFKKPDLCKIGLNS